jgi:hypothetical protein
MPKPKRKRRPSGEITRAEIDAVLRRHGHPTATDLPRRIRRLLQQHANRSN